MSKHNRFDPSTALLGETLDRFRLANEKADVMMKAKLFAAFPVLAALDFREVLVRAFGDTQATEVERRLQAALLPKENERG